MLDLTVGEIVKSRRKELGLTQAQLAEMINSDPYYISRIESGRRKPGRKHLRSLANALNISCDSLMGIDSDIVLHEQATEMEKVLKSLVEEDREFLIRLFYETAQRCRKKE